MKNNDIIFTVILFYIGWFGSVFLAKTAFSIASLLFPVLLIGFLFVKKNLNVKAVFFASLVSILGIVFDFALVHFGFISVSGESLFLIPAWLISIWLLYAFSMLKLGPRLSPPIWIAVLLGMIMGPLSYKSGEAFQVLTFSNSTTFYIYAAFWAVMFPLVLTLSKRFV